MVEVGSRIAAFEILSLLGRGGMGEVFLARDTRLGRKVALKMVAGGGREPEKARADLLREAQIAASLNHPNICTVFDVGTDDGSPYVVMEYVEGRTLLAATPPGGLPVEDVVGYGMAIAGALDHAHERGLVHRDLKSANVMITDRGQIKVLDFGLTAHAAAGSGSMEAAEDPTLTMAAEIAGTPGYMSPEQLRGELADARSDIWSLGVVLYEMATRGRPFGGGTMFEISTQVLTSSPAPLPEHLPPELGAVIGRCLQRRPERRYRRSREVSAALEVIATTAGRSRSEPVSAAAESGSGSAGAVGALAAVDGAAAGSVESIAVLPLTNLSGDPRQEYFSDGLTEALINDLAKISALKVISRTSAMRYKGSAEPLPEIARRLGVDAVLEGSVLRVGDEVRINAQLVHAATDGHLWADSYTAACENILRLQSDVARAVAECIQIAVTPEERAQLAGTGVVDPRAHEAYLQARYGRNLISRDGFELAIGWARKAIALDPAYARPYELLAEVFLLLGMYGLRRPRKMFPLAKEHAAKALELDELLPDAHSTMGWAVQVHDFDRAASEREYRRALELNPSHEITLMRYGACLIGLGEKEPGLAMLERSIELDPMAPILNALYAYGLYLTRDFDGAIAHSRRMERWEPDFWWTFWNLGEALGARGELDAAVAALEKAYSLERNPFTGGGLAAAYARAGDSGRAEAMLKAMLARATERYVPPYFIALVQEALGRRQEALSSLEKAWQERDSWFSFAAVTPALDGLRDEPRLRQLLREMGLAAAASGA